MEWRLPVCMLVAFALGVQGACPNGFVHLEEGCYYFGVDTMTKADAVSHCLNMSSTVAEFDSCNDFIDVIRAIGVAGFTVGKFWTGAIRTADLWSWETSGAPLVYGAPYWTPFAPLGNATDCAVVDTQGDYMEPVECASLAFPMCETPVVKDKAIKPREVPKVVCPSPFTAVGERCFYLNPVFQNWDSARQSCSDMIPGTLVDLAVLNTCDVFESVVRFLEASETGVKEWVWVGANDYQESGVYRWISGDFVSPGVPFWCPGQPNNFGEKQNCAMLWGTNFYYGADEDCTSIHKSLCEIGV